MPKINVFCRFYSSSDEGATSILDKMRFLKHQCQQFKKWMERSDTIILGILGILAHFRHSPACPARVN